MKRIHARSCYALFAYCAFAIAASNTLPARAATSKLVGVSVEENLESNGFISYRIVAGTFPLLDRIESLTGPDGASYTFAPFKLTSASPPFPSFVDVSPSLFGVWTFRTAPNSNPLSVEQYAFEILPFESSDVTVSRPTILQPANGSSVVSPFDF